MADLADLYNDSEGWALMFDNIPIDLIYCFQGVLPKPAQYPPEGSRKNVNLFLREP